MKVLAIDSSGLTATVAVVEETQTIAEYTINYKKTHSQTLLPMIDQMAKMIELDLDSLDAIAVAGGPGSFTGLRIGSATAKGLGLALGKPLIHVPTLEGLAYGVYGCGDLICPLMDARRNQVYTGIYTFSAESKGGKALREPVFQTVKGQMAVSIEELIRQLNVYGKPIVLLGDGVPVHEESFEAGLTVPYSIAPAYMNRQRAAVVGALGIHYYKEGRFQTAAQHQPEYLRPSQAERERAERKKASQMQKEKEAAKQEAAHPISVRTMTPEDAAAAAEIEAQCFSDAWSETAVKSTLRHPQTICLAAEQDGHMLGYLFVYTAADEAEIARIGVNKNARRQGIGSLLMEELGKICGERRIKKLMLDVRTGNQAARAFYHKHGFSEDGIRREFYENPKEDAILMSQVP